MRFDFGPHTLSLEWKPDGKLTGHELALGCYDPVHKIVELSKGLKGRPSDGFEVLLHELTHVVAMEMRADLCEEQVNLIAFGLAELFIRNPKLFELLQEFWEAA